MVLLTYDGVYESFPVTLHREYKRLRRKDVSQCCHVVYLKLSHLFPQTPDQDDWGTKTSSLSTFKEVFFKETFYSHYYCKSIYKKIWIVFYYVPFVNPERPVCLGSRLGKTSNLYYHWHLKITHGGYTIDDSRVSSSQGLFERISFLPRIREPSNLD